MNYDTELKVAVDIAKQAGQIMRQYFDGDQRVVDKEDGTPVTIADTTINSMVIEELAKTFPEDGVIGEEESTAEYGKGRKWFCDPLDGTKAFIQGIPTSMFSLGLVVDGKPMMGVIYDPYLDRMYSAKKGQGSFCNGKQLSVSDKELTEGLVLVTGSVGRLVNGLPHAKALDEIGVEMSTCHGGAYKCMLVAQGRFVAYIVDWVNAHDMAAAQLIIEEAGGMATAMDGSEYDYTKPFKGTIVSNGVVHDEVVRIYQENS